MQLHVAGLGHNGFDQEWGVSFPINHNTHNRCVSRRLRPTSKPTGMLVGARALCEALVLGAGCTHVKPQSRMPTILSHPAVPLGLAIALGPANVSGRLLAAGVLASIAPDLDVLGFRLGIAYSHELGHRGFTHSLALALALAMLVAPFAHRLTSRPLPTFLFVFVACASHGLLDMLTTGGHGIALFWPFSEERFFWPVQVIEVSTLNLRRFFGEAGWAVLGSELRWVWLPAAVSAAVGYGVRRHRAA